MHDIFIQLGATGFVFVVLVSMVLIALDIKRTLTQALCRRRLRKAAKRVIHADTTAVEQASQIIEYAWQDFEEWKL